MEIDYDTLTLKEASEQVQNIDMTDTINTLDILNNS
jgi:hypothetical protein